MDNITIVLPINHPSNRVGEIMFQRVGVGEVRFHKDTYFAWDVKGYRGYPHSNMDAALDSLGRRRGFDEDGFGKNHVGKLIEKYATGEIWKHEIFYYVWWYVNSDIPDTDPDVPGIYRSLSSARTRLGVHIEPPAGKTKPKSAYPQNQKGYKADSIKATKK